MRMAAIQLQPVLGEIDANLERVELLVTRAAVHGAQVVALPEFFTTASRSFPN
jgi:predicted amidohydrolase